MAIEEVVFERKEDRQDLGHTDERRKISVVFNGDIGDFVAKQVKIATIFQNMPLGGHYHDYRELFCLFGEEGTFARVILEDIETKQREEYALLPEGRILIPARVAHIIPEISKGAMLVGCTEEIYVIGKSDHKYEIEY